MIWKYIKADQFFPDYCPEVKNYKRKISGRNGRGNPCEFTPEDIREIRKGIAALSKDLKNATLLR